MLARKFIRLGNAYNWGSSLEDLTSIKGTLKFQILFKFDDFEGFSLIGRGYFLAVE